MMSEKMLTRICCTISFLRRTCTGVSRGDFEWLDDNPAAPASTLPNIFFPETPTVGWQREGNAAILDGRKRTPQDATSTDETGRAYRRHRRLVSERKGRL
jgi:hypothetical protein